MTISDNYVPTKTIGNGVTVLFTATWNVISSSFIRVFLENISTGVQVLQVLDTDYSLTFDDTNLTVDFTIGTPPPNTENVIISREIAKDQTDPFKTSLGFQGEVVENSYDKLTGITQDMQDDLERTLGFPVAITGITNPTLPTPVDDLVLAWDGTTGLIKNGPSTAAIAAAATEATNAAASAAAALVSETNAAASANSQIRFTFDTSIVMADPGLGDFRLNNATVSSVTEIAFDAAMAQTGDPDISDYLATWDDSTNTVKGQLTLIKKGEPQTFALFNVTNVVDNTGWLQVTVTHVASNDTFSSADNIDTFFARAGDVGAAGGGLTDVVDDTTPQLGGDLDVNGQSIVSVSDGDIPIAPNGTGDVILDGLKWPQADGSANQVIETDGAGQLSFVSPGGGFSNDLLHIQDQKSSGTNGGTFTLGAWRTRVLNTVVTNEITGASLAANQITLPSGTYYVEASATCFKVSNNALKLRNITDASDEIIGTVHVTATTDATTVGPIVTGRFTIAAEKDFELQHQSTATKATDGFGQAGSFSVIEVYSDIRIWKVG